MSATVSSTYTGRRVTYHGPLRMRAGTVPSYQELFNAGVRRAPTRAEWVHLRPGTRGTVGNVVTDAVDAHDADCADAVVMYEVDFDNGVQATMQIPSHWLDFVPPSRWRVWWNAVRDWQCRVGLASTTQSRPRCSPGPYSTTAG